MKDVLICIHCGQTILDNEEWQYFNKPGEIIEETESYAIRAEPTPEPLHAKCVSPMMHALISEISVLLGGEPIEEPKERLPTLQELIRDTYLQREERRQKPKLN